MNNTRSAVVVGVGPGLGGAVAKRFAKGGLSVALLARDAGSVKKLTEEISAAGGRALPITCDATDAAAVGTAIARAGSELGPVEALIYNAGAFQMAGILELSPEDFEHCWKTNCMGAFLAARAVVPGMLERGHGTLILTGATASLRGGARFAGLAVGKFGLRALAQSMARELGPQGIHVAHVVIDGQIDTPRVRSLMPGRAKETMLAPEAIAETYWALHGQDKTAWTQELDIRPGVEKF